MKLTRLGRTSLIDFYDADTIALFKNAVRAFESGAPMKTTTAISHRDIRLQSLERCDKKDTDKLDGARKLFVRME